MEKKILKEELSIGNYVKYNGEIGQVVAILNEEEIMWCPNNGGVREKVAIDELKPVTITPDLFDAFIEEKNYPFEKSPEESIFYKFNTSQGSVQSFRCYMAIANGIARLLVWDEDCTISSEFCTSAIYQKMHCLQNFITSLVRDLAGGIK